MTDPPHVTAGYRRKGFSLPGRRGFFWLRKWGRGRHPILPINREFFCVKNSFSYAMDLYFCASSSPLPPSEGEREGKIE